MRKKRLHFGLVFQSFNLFPQYTALKNVTLAPELAGEGAAGLQAEPRKRSYAQLRAGGPGLSGAGGPGRPGWTIIPTSSPADSSSGWPSPGRWP